MEHIPIRGGADLQREQLLRHRPRGALPRETAGDVCQHQLKRTRGLENMELSIECLAVLNRRPRAHVPASPVATCQL